MTAVLDHRAVRTTMPRSWVRRHPLLVGLLAFVALSFVWFHGVWVDPAHRQVGQLGDPDNYIFALAWPPFAIAHHTNPFATDYLLAPGGANLMWSIPPGFGLLLWPLTVTVGPVVTYNLLATLSLGVSAWTAQLALRRFVPGELGPFVGGLFYGFSPYMAVHSIAHAMLTVAIFPPFSSCSCTRQRCGNVGNRRPPASPSAHWSRSNSRRSSR